jgi:HEAT repeat protein
MSMQISSIRARVDAAAREHAMLQSPVGGTDDLGVTLASARRYEAAVRSLRDVQEDETIAVLSDLLAASPIRAAAARVLASLATPASVDTLLSAAASPDPATSESALQAIRQLEPADPLSGRVLQALEVQTAPRVREPLLVAALSGEVNAVSDRIARIDWRKLPAAERRLIVRTLGGRAGTSDTLLQEALRDKDRVVRIEAATALCMRGRVERFADLQAAALERSPAIREAAVFAAGRLSLPEGTEIIGPALVDESATVRMSAMISLVFLNQGHMHEALDVALRDPNQRVRMQAEAAARLVLGARPGAVSATTTAATRLFQGRPARLEDFVALLLDAVLGIYAAGQLASATGEDHAFRAGADAIANLNAVDEWRAALSATSGARVDGRWYYQGAEVQP